MEIQKEDLIRRRETLIKHIIGEMKKDADDASCQNLTARFRIWLSWEEFLAIFTQCANYILRKRGLKTEFVIDEINKPVIIQLWFYLIYDNRFEGNLDKGILLHGDVGVGKTLLLESFVYLQNRLWNYHKTDDGRRYQRATFIHSTEIAGRMKSFESTRTDVDITKCPLAIDEIGREPREVLDYGNVTCPMAELVSARADKAIITHGTTNFSFKTLFSEDNYGEMIGDRMRSMFNFISLKGDSRRM